jgi:hypothetical protein
MVKVKAAVNANKTAGPGASKKTQQDRFSLIVASVGSGYAVEAQSDSRALEESVTGAASGGFQREMEERGEGGDILGLDGGFETELGCELTHKMLIPIGLLTAQPMIEMEDERHYSQAWSKLNKGAQ